MSHRESVRGPNLMCPGFRRVFSKASFLQESRGIRTAQSLGVEAMFEHFFRVRHIVGVQEGRAKWMNELGCLIVS